jgi:hypothetical protein
VCLMRALAARDPGFNDWSIATAITATVIGEVTQCLSMQAMLRSMGFVKVSECYIAVKPNTSSGPPFNRKIAAMPSWDTVKEAIEDELLELKARLGEITKEVGQRTVATSRQFEAVMADVDSKDSLMNRVVVQAQQLQEQVSPAITAAEALYLVVLITANVDAIGDDSAEMMQCFNRHAAELNARREIALPTGQPLSGQLGELWRTVYSTDAAVGSTAASAHAVEAAPSAARGGYSSGYTAGQYNGYQGRDRYDYAKGGAGRHGYASRPSNPVYYSSYDNSYKPGATGRQGGGYRVEGDNRPSSSRAVAGGAGRGKSPPVRGKPAARS